MASPAAKAKPAPVKAAEGTDYIVLEMDGMTPQRVVGRASGRKGIEAIKRATLKPDQTYMAGSFKAIPASAWDGEGNNLLIEVEVRPVVSFKSPVTTNGHVPEIEE